MKAQSLEVKMASHKIAQQRRKDDKPIWDGTLRFKHVLERSQERTDNEHCSRVANEIGGLLKKQIPGRYLDCNHDGFDLDLEDVIDMLCGMEPGDFESEDGAMQELNGALSEVYDWADIERFWIV